MNKTPLYLFLGCLLIYHVNGRPRPEETLIFKFREDPWSVHFKWLGQEDQGRHPGDQAEGNQAVIEQPGFQQPLRETPILAPCLVLQEPAQEDKKGEENPRGHVPGAKIPGNANAVFR